MPSRAKSTPEYGDDNGVVESKDSDERRESSKWYSEERG